MELTSLWARRSRAEYDRLELTTHLWGIAQCGVFWPHREKSLEDLVRLNFSGYALGGLGICEPKTQLFEILDRSAGSLPPAKPRYLMGLGYIEDILEAVERGIDFFDCVLPTRNARNGTLLILSSAHAMTAFG